MAGFLRAAAGTRSGRELPLSLGAAPWRGLQNPRRQSLHAGDRRHRFPEN